MKKISPKEKNKTNGNFWIFAGLLCILLISTMAQEVWRPFVGLHSWGKASGAWAARSHVKYGLGYTKGMSTWAVGNPPTEKPSRYMDHPQLGALSAALFMRIFGVNESSRRISEIILSVATLLLFLRILSKLLDDKTTLLAGLMYVLFPITGYFGLGYFVPLMGFWAIWCYLVLIGALYDGPEPKTLHKIGLVASLFLAIQFGWHGFFYPFAIAVHYIARCVYRRSLPDKGLLAILIIAPLSSLALNFTIMAAGYGWNFQKIIELYKWCSAKGEMQEFLWGAWFAKFWEFAGTNFTIPVLIIAILYLTFGQLIVFSYKRSGKKEDYPSRRFPQFWLFLLTPISQLFALKGCLWKHQTWERPFGPFIAIAAALGIMLLADFLARIRPLLAKISTVILVGIITIWCVKGLNYYQSITHFSPEKVKLFKMLNESIPPDKMLLSFENFIVNQHSAKGAHYRPEVAWYLDREIVQARTLEEIQKQAKTGRFPYYLLPTAYYDKEVSAYLANLSKELQQRYRARYIPPDPGGPTNAPMLPYMLFDLYSKGPGS